MEHDQIRNGQSLHSTSTPRRESPKSFTQCRDCRDGAWNLRGIPVGKAFKMYMRLGHADGESRLVKAHLAAIIFLNVADLKGVRAGSQ